MSSGPIALDRIRSAAIEIENQAVRTPLVLLELDGVDTRIYLKLENLQPIGSFKLRGALNALAERGSRRCVMVW